MNNLCIFFAVALTFLGNACVQQNGSEEGAKYVIFTSNRDNTEIGQEGIFKYSSKVKTEPLISFPVVFCFISKDRQINACADSYKYDLEKLSKIRKVTKRDSLETKVEPYKFLKSVDLIDMDVLFPKMTKEEFIKFWNTMVVPGNIVYFIDRSEIVNHKIKLYPVYMLGINLY